MILNCSRLMNCLWLNSDTLVDFVLDYIQDPTKLSSPLKIRDFATSTKYVFTKHELLNQIVSKSKETAKSFAEEVKNLPQDKRLFLLFLFVSDRFGANFIESRYSDLVVKLNIERPWPFSRILDWFSVDKVLKVGPVIQISHGSYREALEYLLNDDGYPSALSTGVFSKILTNLLEYNNNISDIIETIIENIEYLPSSFTGDLNNRLGREKARRRVFDSLISKNKFYNRNSLELLSTEDKFFLYCVINNKLDEDILGSSNFRWNKVWKNLLYLEKKFMKNASEKLLLTIGSSLDVSKIHTQYYEKIFHNLVEFKIKKMLRDRHFLLVKDMYSHICSNSTLAEISRNFHFNAIDHSFFIGLLRKLIDTGFVGTTCSGKFAKSTRKLVAKVYSEKEIDTHQRIVYYILDITKSIVSNYHSYRIQDKAISYAEKIKHHPVFEGKEPLRVAAMLIFLAGREYRMNRFVHNISDATGVSTSYLSSNYKKYAHAISRANQNLI